MSNKYKLKLIASLLTLGLFAGCGSGDEGAERVYDNPPELDSRDEVMLESELKLQPAKAGQMVILNLETDKSHPHDSGGLGHDIINYEVEHAVTHTFCSLEGVKLQVYSYDELLAEVSNGECRSTFVKAGIVTKKYHNLTNEAMTLFVKIEKINNDDSTGEANTTQRALRYNQADSMHVSASRDCPFCDLSNLNLSRHSFSNAYLFNSNFSGADLSGSIFYQANLQGTNLTNTNLSYANLDLARLNRGLISKTSFDTTIKNTNFSSTRLNQTNFDTVTLECPNFSHATLPHASFFDGALLDTKNKNCKFDLSYARFDANILRKNSNTPGVLHDWSGFNMDYVNLSNIYNLPYTDLSNLIANTSSINGISFIKRPLPDANFESLTLKDVNFDGSDLSRANFQNATLINVSFKGATLASAGFRNATLTDVSFRGANLTGSDFGSSNLTDMVFDGANLTDSDFEGSILSGATIKNSKIGCAKFNALDLTNMIGFVGNTDAIERDENGSELCRTDFSEAVIKGSIISPDEWKNFNMSKATVADIKDLDLTHKNFDNAKFSSVDFTGVNFSDSNFSNATLQYTKFLKTNLSGVTMTDTDASHAKFTHAYIKNGNFNKANFTNASLDSIIFHKSKSTGAIATFANANLTNAKFSNSILLDVDISGINVSVTGATFDNSILYKSSFDARLASSSESTNVLSFNGAHLEGVYFGSANFESVNFTNAYVSFNSSTKRVLISPHEDLNIADYWVTLELGATSYLGLTLSEVTCVDSSNGPCSLQTQWMRPNSDPEYDNSMGDVKVSHTVEVNIKIEGFSDPDSDILSYSVSSTPDLNISIVKEADSFYHIIAPIHTQTGVYAMDLNVSDGKGGIFKHKFNVTVTNISPVYTDSSMPFYISVDADLNETIPISGFSDGDKDTLTYTLETNPQTDLISLIDNSIYVDVGLPPDVYHLRISARDGFGGVVSAYIFVDKRGAATTNSAPTYDGSMPASTSIYEGVSAEVAIAGFVDQDAGDTLSYSIVSAPNTTEISLQGGSVAVSNKLASGEYTVTIRATDTGGRYVQTSITITVIAANANDSNL